jgi:hypothetical protein
LIDKQKNSENFSSERFTLDDVLSNIVSISKVLFDLIIALLDGILDLVKSSRLKCNTNSLLPFLVFEASLEHLLDDVLHFLINDNGGVGGCGQLLSELAVSVNTLVDQGFDVLGALVQIEKISRLEGKSSCLIIFFKIVENL